MSPHSIARAHLDAALAEAGEARLDAERVYKALASQLLARWAAIAEDAPAATPALAPAPTAVSAPPWADREPRISLCMMVRDEERFLRSAVEFELEHMAGDTDIPFMRP